ncbi:rhodanese-like domain-containing protein [bacterium]|nr:rhodanese-like domain-containing protein [bacterium]
MQHLSHLSEAARSRALPLLGPSTLAGIWNDVLVVDVRPEAAALAEPCPIGSALNVPLSRLEPAAACWPAGLPIVTVSRSGLRAAVGALVLRSMGLPQVGALNGTLDELHAAAERTAPQALEE